MLLMVFKTGEDRYALEAGRIEEIVPSLALRRMPHAPGYIAGLFNYRGAVVPVVDLSLLLQGRACPDRMSTRIMLVRIKGAGSAALVGLRAEQATETLKVRDQDLVSPGIPVSEAPYLGNIINDSRGMIQCVQVEHLLPKSLLDSLFLQIAGQA
jgi:chemotaxis-related protein WspB